MESSRTKGRKRGAERRFVGMSDEYKERLRKRFFAKVDKSGDCWLWTGAGNRKKDGYGVIGIAPECFADGRQRLVTAHRVSVFLSTGIWYPSHAHVQHSCDRSHCVRPGHLSVGTNQSNVDDAKRKGRGRWMHSRLTPEDVRVIRRLRAEGMTFRAIAKRFGICLQSAHNVATGVTWGWVVDVAA